MKLGVLREAQDRRVALVPAALGKLNLPLLLESGAGEAAGFPDTAYGDQTTISSRAEVLTQADLILTIAPLPEADLAQLRPNTVLVALFEPFNQPEIADTLNQHQVRAFSLDMIPRTTLAQSMDVLSSMASIAGYKAALTAASYLPRYFPMMITAAGSIRPAKVVVLGAGVAGLQAIATAKRLGAVVEAFDVRQAAKQEVESLGAKFIEVEGAVDQSDAGGYAVEQSEDFIKRQQAEVQARAGKADVIITTAQVRGRKAPLLLPRATVEQMRPGSVVVDLAASSGGNCELTKDKEQVWHQGVLIIGDSALAASMPQDASTLFSNNAVNFLKLLIDDSGNLTIDMENEIVRSALITTSPESTNP